MVFVEITIQIKKYHTGCISQPHGREGLSLMLTAI